MSTATSDTTTTAAASAKTKSLWTRAAWRWITVTGIMAVLWVLYNRHPYYLRAQFAPWRPVYNFACMTWLALGLPYAYVTMKKFSSRSKDMRDNTLHWMLLIRGAWRGKMSHLTRSRRVKTTILSIFVKLFYIPLMVTFFSGHSNNIARNWAFRKHQPVFGDASRNLNVHDWWKYVHDTVPNLLPNWSDFSALFDASWWNLANVRFAGDMYYDILFFVDCGWALMGYCLESQWLKNKTRSVEPTALGWAAALSCYPPFNDVLGTYLPLDQSHQFIESAWGQMTCRLLMLAAFTVYAAATVAFGFKFSNLTNRGITDKGPYRFLRHPAYVCKGFAWWMEYLPRMSLQTAFFLTGLNLVYALRAWTEERHLSQDPDYIAYKKKVPWVIIPGIY
jgi:protein-S-isoprenylcysteine O-methyltransferase Ste14